jgi:hypothetical protein
MNTFNRCVARVLMVCTLGMFMSVSSLAGIVTTDRVYAGAVAAAQRAVDIGGPRLALYRTTLKAASEAR